jgi:hypothetical protein
MPPPTNALGFGPLGRGFQAMRQRQAQQGTGGLGLLQNPTPQPRYGGQSTGGQALLQQPGWAAPAARVQPFSNVARQPPPMARPPSTGGLGAPQGGALGNMAPGEQQLRTPPEQLRQFAPAAQPGAQAALPGAVAGPGLRGAPSDSYLTGRMGEPLPTPGPTRAPDTGASVQDYFQQVEQRKAAPGAGAGPGPADTMMTTGANQQGLAEMAARGLQAAPTAAAPGMAAAVPLASQLYGPTNAQLGGAARALGPARRPEWGPRR